MMESILIDGLVKAYGRREVLHGIDLSVPAGGIFGLIGPNGAGKTTIMRCLLDVIRPSAGTLSVLGRSPREAGPALRRRIGYLPGDLVLEGRTTGRRLLRHYAELGGPVRPGRAETLAERLGVDLDAQVRRLSKGNKQKIGLIQALMHEPELLVLDEPTSGLDPLMQREFLLLLREATARGQTVFLSSHMLSQVQQAADSVAILRDGRIALVAGVESLRETARRRVRIAVSSDDEPALRGILGRLDGLRDRAVVPGTAGDAGTTIATATVEGPVGPLVRALAGIDVVDLVLEEPDLEEAVLTLYGGERS
ncbi:MAG: ABC transporter ATP-binding protein [Arthrobacter sp.]|uniref:ABC transporter ATP-binding protein n=1 Tax=Arthrobacter sp. TaxID=1667 RepID=UPI00346ABB4F